MSSIEEKIGKVAKYLTVMSFVITIFLVWFLPYFASRYNSPITSLIIKILASYQLLWVLYFLLSRAKKLEKAMSYCLIGVSIVFAIVLIESSTLLGFDFRRLFGNLTDFYLYDFNQVGQKITYTHKPNFSMKGVKQGGNIADGLGAPVISSFKWDVRFDRDGFRNVSEVENPDIAILGDSVVESIPIADNDWIVQKIASGTGKKVRSYALSGQGPYDQLEILKKYVLKDKPKHVLWFFSEANDVVADIEFWEKWQDTMHSHMADLTHIRKRLFTKNLLNSFEKFLRPKKHSSIEAWNSSCLHNKGTAEEIKQYFLFPLNELKEQDFAGLAKLERIWSTAWALLKEQGIGLSIVYVPVKFRVYRDHCYIAQSSDLMNWDLNLLPKLVKERIRNVSSAIDIYDLTSVLKTAVRAGETVFFPDDTHFNENGHQISAQYLIQKLPAK